MGGSIRKGEYLLSNGNESDDSLLSPPPSPKRLKSGDLKVKLPRKSRDAAWDPDQPEELGPQGDAAASKSGSTKPGSSTSTKVQKVAATSPEDLELAEAALKAIDTEVEELEKTIDWAKVVLDALNKKVGNARANRDKRERSTETQLTRLGMLGTLFVSAKSLRRSMALDVRRARLPAPHAQFIDDAMECMSLRAATASYFMACHRARELSSEEGVNILEEYFGVADQGAQKKTIKKTTQPAK